MSPLYPLRFRPILKRYLWGGRRLETILGKELGEGNDYAESWEVVDHGADQSIVTHGAFRGASLNELVVGYGADLLGRHHPLPHFPLLFKFLDANDRLSVQVHPDDTQAAALVPPDSGKTEAWVILDAQPGSALYAGLKQGIKRVDLENAVVRGVVEECVHRFEPQPGDCIFLPAGVVHAIGAGLLVAEIQQSSDTTYRLFDWNRTGPDGQPRALHISEALAVIDFEHGPVSPRRAVATDHPDAQCLVRCDKFVLERRQLSAPARIGGDGRCHLLAVIEGSLQVAGDPAERPLGKGEVILLPAGCGQVLLSPSAGTALLDAYLP